MLLLLHICHPQGDVSLKDLEGKQPCLAHAQLLVWQLITKAIKIKPMAGRYISENGHLWQSKQDSVCFDKHHPVMMVSLQMCRC